MNKFLSFNGYVRISYPVGSRNSNNYCKQSANKIKELCGDIHSVILVCQGTSGTILSGAIQYILNSCDGIVCQIVVSRKKEEKAHCISSGLYTKLTGLDGMIEDLDNVFIVVVDDFIESGATISNILSNLDNSCIRRIAYDLLIVSNESREFKVGTIINETITKRFQHILSNV